MHVARKKGGSDAGVATLLAGLSDDHGFVVALLLVA
jgi:hypothetical protein